ncbi:hypothetical protein POM88_028028 [Heracleum sosnowskyi]|uniref:DC1 domain-containing protein n=1 Tax=Heracleum sosnowskyi TaxID=360622 RepID=A0AAD8IA51_9APIA|nr:hypothetical protein POM88_028028 [Heracleum sosnowskyi]
MNQKKKKTKEKRIKHCSRKEYDFQGNRFGDSFSINAVLVILSLWHRRRCASAPPKLIFKSHDIDHPLVLDYSLPEEYQKYGVSCNLCREEVDPSLWLYYCRYFAHMKCVLSAIESGEDRNINEDVGDVDDPDLVHFPVSEDNPSLLYQLIQKFAENFSTSTDERSGGKSDKISHCSNGHSLVLFDQLNNKKVVETESSESMICDGCVQPILSPPDSFYGCIDCNFFLHTICAAELPREIQHASHPQHKLIRCDRMSKPNAFFTCGFCYHLSSGMFYRCDSCKLYIDLVCAAMPSEIKHAAHKHKLIHDNLKGYRCAGCGWNFGNSFRCDICNYKIDVRCARKPGRIKHRWDEHQLCMMYPPVKGHPHDFNCERCSEDIDPNSWFYHCRECDTSFHDGCLDQVRFTNIKCGSIVKDDDLHQHSLKISLPVSKACGTDEGSKDFSYLCKTCLFFIHNRCASAPPKLIFKSHDIDHPLVLDYSLPEEYQKYGVSCNLCREQVDPSLWLYYCAYCRYFAHMKCVLSATESGEDRNINGDVGDVDDPDLVHFPVSEDNPSLLYQLIQKFAENFSTSTDERSGGKADKIRHCGNGHSLVLFDELNNKKVVETESSESMICDGCVQPILSPPDSFYGCIDCNFFLHTICAAELPREFQHASHPQHKLIRCDRMSKPNAFFICRFCNTLSSGMFYRCDSCKFYIDLVCAAMPSEIKHAAHKHKLIYDNVKRDRCCAGCGWNYFGNIFRCDICNYQIDVRCARKPGRNKHRWDEHQLCMMYPPVKAMQVNSTKFGAIVKISPPGLNFKCGSSYTGNSYTAIS